MSKQLMKRGKNLAKIRKAMTEATAKYSLSGLPNPNRKPITLRLPPEKR